MCAGFGAVAAFYLLAQPTKMIPGTSAPYYGTVDVR